MPVLGVDLATRRYRDIGLALLQLVDQQIRVDFIRPVNLGWTGLPEVTTLVDFVVAIAEREGSHVLALDGPQAWKAPHTGLEDARHCEQRLHTQTKTGLPGQTKPRTALRFADFSIQCFDLLAALGWSRLQTPADLQPDAKLALEVFPTATWRALGLKPLPAKAKTTLADVTRWLGDLQQRVPLVVPEPPTHDELQALVAGLVGLAVAQGESSHYELYGGPLQLIEQSWREGYIVNLKKGSYGNS